MRGEPAVVLTAFGEGATSQGEVHEAMNFAGVHRLPVLCLCENNGWAISVPLSLPMAVESPARRAEGYGSPRAGVDGDGSDRYRDPEGLERGRREKDPLPRLRDRLLRLGLLDEEADRRIHVEAEREVEEAVAWAEASPWPDPAGLPERLFATPVGQAGPP